MRRNTQYSNFHRGFREHLGVSVRSSWENNVLCWMKHKRMKWEYEPEIFYFESIKRGTRGYTPDIRLKQGRDYKWVEVKGYLRPQDRTKIKRFKKYYPEECARLVAITKNEKSEATKFFQEMGVPIMAYYDDLVKEFKGKLRYWE